jgi:uncharacterized protein involved in exopolysaccharide biosynthesis/Mrp family chromosome partitioning ATPase
MQASLQAANQSGAAPVNPADELDLRQLGLAVWQHKRWILGLTLGATALAFAAVNVITPYYSSEARVLVETRDNIFLRPEAEKTTERTTVDPEAVNSQVQLILSRDLARDIIKKFKLAERPEFDVARQGASILRTVLGLIGLTSDLTETSAEERVLKSYFERLRAYQVDKSRVINIEFQSQDPQLAASVANGIAEGYLVLQRTAKQAQSRVAGQWLAGEIENLRTKVAEAEAKVETYRSKTNLFIGTQNTTLSNQQLGDFNAQLVAARALKADAESKSRLIRSVLRAGGPIEFSDITNSELMRRLSEQRATLRAQLAEQSSTLLSGHPRIKELRAQIGDLDRQLRIEADRLARSLENDAKVAGARLEALSTALDQLKQQAASTNEQDVQLRALERDAKSQRDLLESYLAKYRETVARDSLDAASPDARVISTALVSNTPAWPKKIPTVLIAALGMFMLASGFVVTGELLRTGGSEPRLATTVYPPAELTAADSATVKTVPAATAAAEAMAAPTASPEQREERALQHARRVIGVPLEVIERLARDLAAAGDSSRRVTVVGALRNVGTTYAAITLARTLSRNSRVVLVDLALGGPNLSTIASDPAAPGIVELVNGTASFGQIITRDRYSRVHLIQAGRTSGSPIDVHAIISSQRLAITLEALARSYDHVVVDAGAVPEVAVERFASMAPRAVLVAADSVSPTTVSARERLVSAGFNDVTVLVSMPRGPEMEPSGNRAAA